MNAQQAPPYSATDYCVFLSNATVDDERWGESLWKKANICIFKGYPWNPPLCSFSPFYFFFVIIQPFSPSFHRSPLSFAFSTTLDDASIEILLASPPPFEWFRVLSSPFNHPTLHTGGWRRGRRRTSSALDDSCAELGEGRNVESLTPDEGELSVFGRVLMDYLEPDTMRIYRSGFVLLPVVTKLDRYGDLGRDKSFPFTQRARLRLPIPPNIDHVTRNSNDLLSPLLFLFVDFPKFLLLNSFISFFFF